MFEWFYDLLNRLDIRRERARGVVNVTLLSVTSHRGRKTKSMQWNEVRQIDAGRKPTGLVEYFYVVLFDEHGSILIDDAFSGFAEFQAAVLDHWPEIETAWTRVFTGSPDVEEYVTLWKRRESY
ncbi:MAG TPA: hypothetical protein VHE09_09605 [Rhizomicrobium sp.]|nr:hypothetical protein [Rhizomicrobium sp.]